MHTRILSMIFYHVCDPLVGQYVQIQESKILILNYASDTQRHADLKLFLSIIKLTYRKIRES